MAAACSTRRYDRNNAAPGTSQDGIDANNICAYIKGANGRRCKNKAPRGIYCSHHACPVDGCGEPKSSQAPRCATHNGSQGM